MKPTRKEIENLAWTNPIIYHIWNQIEWSNLTYEEGLILMVSKLAEQNQHLTDVLLKHHEVCTHPNKII